MIDKQPIPVVINANSGNPDKSKLRGVLLVEGSGANQVADGLRFLEANRSGRIVGVERTDRPDGTLQERVAIWCGKRAVTPDEWGVLIGAVREATAPLEAEERAHDATLGHGNNHPIMAVGSDKASAAHDDLSGDGTFAL